MTTIPRNVVVVIGTGGMGQACARRLASGRQLFLADFSAQILDKTVNSLKADGHIVQGHIVDVFNSESVGKFAQLAGAAGHIDAIIHSAGVSPVMAPVKKILEVDLVGTANVIESFLPVVSAGTSLVCISSLAGYTKVLSKELELFLGTASPGELMYHAEIDLGSASDTYDTKQDAYAIAKRGNHLRIQAYASAYGAKGARINSISPGLISTPMGAQEVDGPGAARVKGLIELSPMKRMGSPDDIASTAAFLAGSESTFITGTDIIIDGGAFAAMRWPTVE